MGLILALLFLLCSLRQSLFLLLTKSFLGSPFFGYIPKIVFDLIHAIIYLGALLATLNEADVSLNALVTGSAVMTAAIGLVFRDTLGSVMADLAIGFSSTNSASKRVRAAQQRRERKSRREPHSHVATHSSLFQAMRRVL